MAEGVMQWTPGPEQCCRHCGQVNNEHHSDGRCYTVEELILRLESFQKTGRFPGPDVMGE